MIKNKLKYTYDEEYDILLLTQADNSNYGLSYELRDGTILDFDINNKPISFEFINASKKFKLNTDELKNIKDIDVNVEITDEIVKINLNIISNNFKINFKDIGVLQSNIKDEKFNFEI